MFQLSVCDGEIEVHDGGEAADQLQLASILVDHVIFTVSNFPTMEFFVPTVAIHLLSLLMSSSLI